MIMEVAKVGLALALLTVLCGVCIAMLSSWVASRRPANRLADRVNDLLPQIQCAKCGYPGCLPYAEAVVAGENLDLCPPGSAETAAALARLLDRPVSTPTEKMSTNVVALIASAKCVGCALCIEECPVDAIVGAEGFAHDVLDQHCTGCELCIPACPVNCISLIRSPAYA